MPKDIGIKTLEFNLLRIGAIPSPMVPKQLGCSTVRTPLRKFDRSDVLSSGRSLNRRPYIKKQLEHVNTAMFCTLYAKTAIAGVGIQATPGPAVPTPFSTLRDFFDYSPTPPWTR
ncbi:hypothetical protein N8T08_006311 [Aspergillus melleus]|uniref:Uncharacterized protein n=1 Tax=Aspergillus melleus TaxID=138277 RepID=A0ACC3B0G0_9EURO|nr:hypothetical protein N8T08_006311 [Aspergillus melleus]